MSTRVQRVPVGEMSRRLREKNSVCLSALCRLVAPLYITGRSRGTGPTVKRAPPPSHSPFFAAAATAAAADAEEVPLSYNIARLSCRLS